LCKPSPFLVGQPLVRQEMSVSHCFLSLSFELHTLLDNALPESPSFPRSITLLIQTMASPLGLVLSAQECLDQRLQFLYPVCVDVDII
jgi:hypothetical protein